MRHFLSQVYTTYAGLFGWLNWFSYVSTVIFRPVVLVTIYAVLGRFAGSPEAVRSYSIGIAAYSMAVIILPGITQCYTYDRSGGTLSFVFASPVNRVENYLARAVLHYPNGLLSFAATLVTAWVMVGLSFGGVNWGGFIAATLVIAMSITALGEFLGTFAIVFRDWSNIQTAFVGLILILSGAIIPLDVFPAPVQELAKLLPVTNGLISLKSTFVGNPLADTSGELLREAMTGVVYVIIGYFGFRMFETAAKKRGTLEQETF
jgi:ABC-2 type transport system permease protein